MCNLLTRGVSEDLLRGFHVSEEQEDVAASMDLCDESKQGFF